MHIWRLKCLGKLLSQVLKCKIPCNQILSVTYLVILFILSSLLVYFSQLYIFLLKTFPYIILYSHAFSLDLSCIVHQKILLLQRTSFSVKAHLQTYTGICISERRDTTLCVIWLVVHSILLRDERRSIIQNKCRFFPPTTQLH